jgi:hypothetical protein
MRYEYGRVRHIISLLMILHRLTDISLIAIMLSRFRMTVEDCILEYENLAGKVFGNARLFHQMFVPTFWLKRPKYDANVLEAVIRGVTQRRGEVSTGDEGVKFATKKELCRTYVSSSSKVMRGPSSPSIS